MNVRYASIVVGLLACGAAGMIPAAIPAAVAAQQTRPTVSNEASAALLRMGQTLRSREFSFKANTIRVYRGPNGQPLHIFHTMTVTVSRPSRLLADITGDDGTNKLVFDGKTLTIFSPQAKKYASIPAPPHDSTIDAMLYYVMNKYGVDMPLADFLSKAPNKSFLTGVTSGKVINTVMIDGSEYLHMFFSQPPGLELELWVAKDGQSLPRRLIVTYRQLPDQPSFVAEFSDWKFDIHPTAAEFTFRAPQDAVQVPLKPIVASAGARKGTIRKHMQGQ